MVDTEYATLDTIKGSVRIPLDRTEEDANLSRALKGASRAIDRVTGRRFYRDDVASARVISPSGKVYNTRNGESILLVPDIATAVGLTVESGDYTAGSSWTAITRYGTWPDGALLDDEPVMGILITGSSWTCGAGARVRVTAVWGWPSVPSDIEEATLILARRLFNRKDSAGGVIGTQEWVTNLARRDPDVVSLLEHFVLAGFG
jgi:hypothetical protein